MRGQRLVQGRCNGEVVCRARTAAVCANGSINHHYSTEPPHGVAFVYIKHEYTLSHLISKLCIDLQCSWTLQQFTRVSEYCRPTIINMISLKLKRRYIHTFMHACIWESALRCPG